MSNTVIVVPVAEKVRPSGFIPEIINDTGAIATIGQVWPPDLPNNARAVLSFIGYDPYNGVVTLDDVAQVVTGYGDTSIEFTVNSTSQMGEVTIVATYFTPGVGAWSSSATYDPATNMTVSGGTPTDAIVVGGQLANFAQSNTAGTFNGTAWTALDVTGAEVITRSGAAAGGTSTSFIITGGWTVTTSWLTEGIQFYNGSTWYTGDPIAWTDTFTGSRRLAGNGEETDFLITGGYAEAIFRVDTFVYNGTSWTTLDDMLAYYLNHVGTGDSGDFLLTGCGTEYAVGGFATYVFNGTAWSSAADCIVNKWSSRAGDGDGRFSMFLGGQSQSQVNGALDSCVRWEDGTWSSIDSLPGVRRWSTCVGDGGSTCLQIAGNEADGYSTNVSTTFEYG